MSASTVVPLRPNTPGTPLYDEMCRAIEAAYRVDELKDLRDKALAIEYYARQAQNVEAESQACEVRLRAERKAGQLLRQIEKAKGAPGNQHTGPLKRPAQSNPTLSDLGVSKQQSSDWQKLAAVPEATFEQALKEPRPTTAGIIRKAAPVEDRVDERSLWLWGRLRDFERDGLLAADPMVILAGMTPTMRGVVLDLAPKVAAWLGRLPT